MINKKNIIIVGMLVLLTSQLWAAPWFGKGKDSARKPAKNIIRELGLTKDQMRTCDEFRLEMRKKQIRIQAQVQESKLELNAELRKDKVDQGKVDSFINEIGKLQTELLRNRVQNMLKVKNVLTTEQREKLLSQGMFGMGMGLNIGQHREKNMRKRSGGCKGSSKECRKGVRRDNSAETQPAVE
ncbi:Spy/CpxP family protein refolding chaperone [Candidatus Margulisiibacteriota bacterium]